MQCSSHSGELLPRDSSSSSSRESAVDALSEGRWLGLLLWEPPRRLGGGGRMGMGRGEAEGLAAIGFAGWEGGAGG